MTLFIYCPFRSRAFYYTGTIPGGYFLVIGQCGRILIGLHFRQSHSEWDRTFSGFGELENSSRYGFKKSFASLSKHVSIPFRMTQLEGFIRQMHKQKVTKLRQRKLHFPKSDKDGVYIRPQKRLFNNYSSSPNGLRGGY